MPNVVKNFRKEQYIREDLENEFAKLINSLRITDDIVNSDKRKLKLKSLTPVEDCYNVEYLDKGWDRSISILEMSDINEWKIGWSEQGKYKMKALPRELKEIVLEFIDFYRYTHDPNYEQFMQELRDNLRVLREDEDGRIVTDGQWRQAADVCDDVRVYGESRAIVVDDSIVCINAAAAIENLPEFEELNGRKWDKSNDPRKMGNLVYKECEKSNGSFRGHRVRYAERDEILAQLER